MTPKKRSSSNAFFFFMLERKAHYEKNGERFPNGLKDVAELVGPEWNVLSASGRKKYEDLAKEEKAKQKADTSMKYTNQHNSFAHMERLKAENEKARQQMNNDIEYTVRSLCDKKMISKFKFYLIHVNYFFITEGECYYPAELALAEFSLGEGVTDVYHTIINTGQIPLGYRHDAMKQSEDVHHIPLEPEEGERNYYAIWKNVKAFLERGRNTNGGGLPPMYTMPDNVILNTSINCVKSVMKTLCESANDNSEEFAIYELEKLLFELKNGCASQSENDKFGNQTICWPNKSCAVIKLEDDIYNFTPNISCSFHYIEDQVDSCSKSFVQRWAYLICDECCQFLNIKLIPGKHVPINADVSFENRHRKNERERKAETDTKLVSESLHVNNHHPSLRPDTKLTSINIRRPPLLQRKLQNMDLKLVHLDTWSPGRIPLSLGRGRGRILRKSTVEGRGSGLHAVLP